MWNPMKKQWTCILLVACMFQTSNCQTNLANDDEVTCKIGKSGFVNVLFKIALVRTVKTLSPI